MNSERETKIGKGFFLSLFDLSFSSFITTKLIKLLYILLIVAGAIVALYVMVRGFSETFGYGLLLFLGAIAGFFIHVVWARVILEMTIILFKIEENTRKSQEVRESKDFTD